MLDVLDDKAIAAAVGRTVRSWRIATGETLDRVATEYVVLTTRPCDARRVVQLEQGARSLTVATLAGWALTWTSLLNQTVTVADLLGPDPEADVLRGSAVPRPLIGSVEPVLVTRADREVARKLGVDPVIVYKVSKNLWGRTFSDERNRRAPDNASPQARGRVSRELREELKVRLEAEGFV